ncbi:hypothetical protein Vretifemale_11828 [Volvox reticuliferus]|uniref:Uncharacterized protein n=1 Tax=Volvox reticuliferus TaxID=1737510 RepID=A0A8J4FQB1_9CHLO|nr:hypothetical protein Vretifemale_11828 [Volvox reticuliferus]
MSSAACCTSGPSSRATSSKGGLGVPLLGSSLDPPKPKQEKSPPSKPPPRLRFVLVRAGLNPGPPLRSGAATESCCCFRCRRTACCCPLDFCSFLSFKPMPVRSAMASGSARSGPPGNRPLLPLPLGNRPDGDVHAVAAADEGIDNLSMSGQLRREAGPSEVAVISLITGWLGKPSVRSPVAIVEAATFLMNLRWSSLSWASEEGAAATGNENFEFC